LNRELDPDEKKKGEARVPPAELLISPSLVLLEKEAAYLYLQGKEPLLEKGEGTVCSRKWAFTTLSERRSTFSGTAKGGKKRGPYFGAAYRGWKAVGVRRPVKENFTPWYRISRMGGEGPVPIGIV